MSKGEVDLEPCKFCGCCEIDIANSKLFGGWYGECLECNTIVSPCRPNNRQEMVAAWNRRPPATAQSHPGEEALREAIKREFWDYTPSLTHEQFELSVDAILAALSVSALPVPVGRNSFSSVGDASPTVKYPSPSLDNAREPAFVEALAIAQYEARARMHRAFTLYSPESWSGLRQGQKEREVAAMWEAFAMVDGSQAPPVPVGGGDEQD